MLQTKMNGYRWKDYQILSEFELEKRNEFPPSLVKLRNVGSQHKPSVSE